MPTRIPVPDLIGGVSQLPPEQRAPNQLAALDNGLSTVRFGLRKRPPTEAVGVISGSTTGYDSAFVHAVNRTDTQRYTVVVANGDLKVYDTITGLEQTVFFPNGKGYLSSALRGFRAFTVGDHTFLVNRNRRVLRGAPRSPSVPNEALLFFRMADYGTAYIVYIDNFSFVYETAPDASAMARIEIATDQVAAGMLATMRNNELQADFFSQFSVVQYGSTLFVRRLDGGDFEIRTRDGLSDKGLKLIKGRVQAMEDLPEVAKDGMVVEIVGNPGSPKDNTWVRYEASTADGLGVWRETTAPNIPNAFDLATMPHELVRQGYLKDARSYPLHRSPTYALEPGGTPTNYGWSTDGADVALAGGATRSQVVTTDGAAVRSEALTTGTSPTAQRKVTINYSIDTGSNFRGSAANVELWRNTGGSWAFVDRRTYAAGAAYRESRVLLGIVPSGTRYELRLTYQGVGETRDARRARLTANGRDASSRGLPAPGIAISAVPNMLLTFGNPTALWPRGAVLSATINGSVFSYTLPNDMDTTAAATAFAAVIDASPTFVASYFAPNPANPSTFVCGVSVTRADGATPAVTALTATLNPATRTWDALITMTPGEHVGRIVRNLTDGSEGVITANSVRAIEVSSLSGGKTNLFNRNDAWAILDTATAYFVFQQCPWADRLVGNDVMTKWPGFVDRQISEVFFHAGRLGFTAEDFVSLSAAGDIYRFWRSTVTQVLDDDPIDIQSAHKDVGFLDSAVQWNGECLLCSSSGHQFTLSGDPVLSPKTVRLDHLASYPVGARTRPLAFGNSVFFPRRAAGFSQLREMYRTRDGLQVDLVTADVPEYIPGDVIDICGDPDHGFLAALPSGGSQNAVYVYTFGVVGDSKRAAWQRWTFPDRVVGIDFYDGNLILVLYRTGQVLMERINIGSPLSDAGNHRDRGTVAYTMTATLSRLLVRDRDGEPISSGRLQVRTVAPQVSSGYVRTEVVATNKPTKTYVRSSRSKRHPVLAENTASTISLVNDQNNGCTITGLEYEVTYSNRSS